MAFRQGKGGDLSSFFVLYGYSGWHESKQRRAGTNNLVNSDIDECRKFPHTPRFLCADLNADLADLAAIKYLIEAEHWTNLGSVADTWGATL